MNLQIPQEVIRRKRDGYEHTEDELERFFDGYMSGTVHEYQMSAWLMAAFLRGLSPKETTKLTTMMRDSGQVFAWSQDQGAVVDKHSTGGVGDKTSLILLPLCVLEGLRVPMMSGRGLGHTGGTLDKLEAIPGIQVRMDAATARKIVEREGGVFMGQSEDLAPLDRRLYALRDVTATVESVSLITASILSKKLCEGLSGLVMDVKWGSGAFMTDRAAAEELARSIEEVAGRCGLPVTTMLTSMNEPLGETAGHALEVRECIDVMQGRGPKATRRLTIALAAEMVRLGGSKDSQGKIEERLGAHLDSGRALEVFMRVIAAQGGDTRVIEDPARLPQAAFVEQVVPSRSGYVKAIDVRSLGLAVLALGGGRRRVEDSIDPGVGLSALVGLGARVDGVSPIGQVHAATREHAVHAASMVRRAYEIADAPGPQIDLIAAISRPQRENF